MKKGYKMSEIAKQHIREAKLGSKNPMYGKRTKTTWGKGHKPWCAGTKGLVIPWNKNKKGIYSKEVLENWSKKRKGKNAGINNVRYKGELKYEMKTCLNCNEQFKWLKCEDKKYCSKKCYILGLKGRKQSKEWANKRGLALRGIKRTIEQKQKTREGVSRYIKNKIDNGEWQQRIGKYEKQILDNLEKCFNYKIDRQYQIKGFFIDGYCKPLNLAIEVDEEKHKRMIIKDREREEIIKSELHCQFLRIGVY